MPSRRARSRASRAPAGAVVYSAAPRTAKREELSAMPLYCTLGRTTPVGAADLRGTAERYEENRRALEAFGAKIISGYACLGTYDFLFILEAPDNETAMRLSALTASRGTSQYE